MTPLKKTARIAGLWYLTFALGPFYLLYVPGNTQHDPYRCTGEEERASTHTYQR